MSSQSRRSYTVADRALLWSRSGGFCCFPECDMNCVQEANDNDPSVVIGQIAHIEAKNDGGPRSNPVLPDELRDSYQNLILLCPTHHRFVDAQENTYTAEMLQEWKTDQESKLLDFLAQGVANITFAELDTITQALANGGQVPPSRITVTPPEEKMARNGLTVPTRNLFNIGLLQAQQVQQFVETMGSLDSAFVGRLTSGFLSAYRDHRQAGLEGDSLFEEMRLFSAQGRTDLRFQCAGLAVLVYLFERCEVFEQ